MLKKIGKYELLRKIGEGGFGVVYLAKDTLLDEELALKVAFETETYQKSLIAEARILWQLKHDHIVATYEANIYEDIFFVAMEYLAGGSLSELIKKKGGLGIQESIDIIVPLLQALEYAHNKRVLHRDLKPSNILFDKNGRPKLTDFGVARMMEHTSVASTKTGTIPYMAPEQLEGNATFRSDIYAMGTVLYEMICGKRAFDGDTEYKIMRKIDKGYFIKPRLINPSIPDWLEGIILKAMSKDVGSRYSSAREMLSAIIAKGVKEKKEVIEKPKEPVSVERERDVVPVDENPVIVVHRDYDKPQKRSEKKIEVIKNLRDALWQKVKPKYSLLKLFSGLIGILGISVLIIWGLATNWGGGDKVVIPDVVGLSQEEASHSLEKHGLLFTIEEEKISSNENYGLVLSQVPKSGKYSKKDFPKGSELVLTIGVESEAILIPDIVGVSKNEAVAGLEKLGFETSLKEVKTAEADQDGMVLIQSPGPGTRMVSGGTVILTIGKYGEGGGGTTLSNYKYCPSCGNAVKKSAQFCPYCGHKF